MKNEDAIEALQIHRTYMPLYTMPKTKEALDVAIAALREPETKYSEADPKWINAEEMLPEEFEPVLFYRTSKYGDRDIALGCYVGNGIWRSVGLLNKSVSHWMPLPEPPKEEV